MIVSFPKETRQNFPPKFYGAGGLLQQQYPMVWSCAVLKLQVGLSCSIPPYLYVYHTRWLLSTSKLKLRNYTCIIFLTEYPCKNTLTGITDFFIMCLGQVNLTKEEWESHILRYYLPYRFQSCFVSLVACFSMKTRINFPEMETLRKSNIIFGPLFSVDILHLEFECDVELLLTKFRLPIKLCDQVEKS